MNKRIGKNDFIFLGIILFAGIIGCILFAVLTNKHGQQVIVEVDNHIVATYSLEKDQTVKIINNDGVNTNILIIKDGVAYMDNANCPDKICVKHKAISRNNETIVCLPNKVVVTVEGDKDSDVDAISN